MSEYNVILELPIRKLDADAADVLMEQFTDFHPAISTSPLGWAEVTITVQAETLRQGIAVALGLAGDVVSVTAMTTVEFDRRPIAAERIPELVSVAEYAKQVGVSRQAVQQRIDSGSLQAVRVGKVWAVPVDTQSRAEQLVAGLRKDARESIAVAATKSAKGTPAAAARRARRNLDTVSGKKG